MDRGRRGMSEAMLRDGSRALVRPITTGDGTAVNAAFERLSDHSRTMRFFVYKKRLTSTELQYFTDVDHVDHEALVATAPDTGEILAIVRYVRLPSDSRAAEVAVTVADEWQGRGLGTVLLSRLADRAREQGIRRFEAQALSENRRVFGLLAKLGALTVKTHRAVSDIVIELGPQPA
jgi:RimJ/RimL family protein N-acetyltransferase